MRWLFLTCGLLVVGCDSTDPLLRGGSGGAAGTGATGGGTAAGGATGGIGGAGGATGGTAGGATGGTAGGAAGTTGGASGGSGAAGGAGGGSAGGAGGGVAAAMLLASGNAYNFYCGIKNGQMACWGSANDSYWATVNAPALTRLPADLVQFAMSNTPYDVAPFCGVDAAGTGICWGPAASRSVGTALTAVVVSDYGICRLALGGSVNCDSLIAAPDPGPNYVMVSASEETLGALDDTGVPWFGSFSFPAGRYTELVANDQASVAAVRSDGAVVSFHETTVPTVVPGSFVHAAIDYFGRVCGLDRSGWIGCWTNDMVGDSTPVVAPTGSFTQLVGGESTFCGVRTDGTIACWGDTPIAIPAGW
jgi:hypothetical protein